MRGHYQTKQYEIILDYLAQDAAKSATAKEINAACRAAGSTIGLATVYRQLEHLIKENKVKKIITEDGGATRFQFAAQGGQEAALYLKCNDCGELTPTDCKMLFNVFDHMGEEHGFQIDKTKSVLYGRCQRCKL